MSSSSLCAIRLITFSVESCSGMKSPKVPDQSLFSILM
nr:MAG TPA: protein of unknown function (DUF5432) [Caudoviricetes sp.]